MKASTATRTTAPAPMFEPGDTVKAWLEHFNVTATCTVRSFRYDTAAHAWFYIVALSNDVMERCPERDLDFLTAR